MDNPKITRSEDGALMCSCCGFRVDHDGHRATHEEPGLAPTEFWCDLCDLVWTPEEVPS